MGNILQAEIVMYLRCRSHIPESAAQQPSLHCSTLDDDDIPRYINQESGILENISVKSYQYSKGLTLSILFNGRKETSEVIFQQNALIDTIRCLEEGDKIKVNAWKEDTRAELLQLDPEQNLTDSCIVKYWCVSI